MGPYTFDLGSDGADLKLVMAGLVPGKGDMRPFSADSVPERAS